jgi:ribosomal protein L11 methyltransferase
VQDVIQLARDGRAWDYADESIFNADDTVLVKAYFPLTETQKMAQFERALNQMKVNSPLDLGSLETIKREIDGDLWREQWKEHFKPLHIGKVVIVPEWINYQPKDNEIKILLDSNMAFGTGEHETTSMCVEYLSEFVSNNDVVLDVGCGSGILGITACKLGAKKVFMTDIDYVAVKTATHNCELNGVSDVCEVALNNLLDDKQIQGELVLANITADVLFILSNTITDNVCKNGVMVMSGIIKSRENEVIDRYSSLGFVLEKRENKGEWVAIAMRKI